MGNTVYDNPVDPFDGDSIAAGAFYHVQSTTKGGTFEDIVAPSGHNYPQAGSSTRTFIYLPMVIDQSDLSGTRPFIITSDIAGDLTPVAVSPAAGEYRLPDTDNSLRAQTVEINSAQWSETISFDYYGKGTILNNDDINPFLEATGVIDHTTTEQSTFGFEAIYRTSAGVESIIGIHHKIVEIGNWDMDGTAGVSVNHGLSDFTKIRYYQAVIITDAGTSYYVLDAVDNAATSFGGARDITATQINLKRTDTGTFDSSAFDDNTINRGWIYIVYED